MSVPTYLPVYRILSQQSSARNSLQPSHRQNPPIPPPQLILHIPEPLILLLRRNLLAPILTIRHQPPGSIKDRIENTPAKIRREFEIDFILPIFHKRLEVIWLDMAAISQCIVESRRGGIFGPACLDDFVAGIAFCFGPIWFPFVSVVRFVEDIADFGVAFWVRGWGFGEVASSGVAGGRVCVEDDLVVRADPGVIPFYDGGGLVPACFMLAALVRSLGGDDVATGARHDGAVVIPAVGTAPAAGGAVDRVVEVSAVAGIFAAHVEDAFVGLYTGVLCDGDGGSVGLGDWREVFEFAVAFDFFPS